MKNSCIFSLLAALVIWACSQEKGPLPVYGNKDVVDGKTVYHTISDFQFIDQDSNIITNATFADKVYVTDFFFTSCKTICPKVKKQMLRIYDKYKDNDQVVLLSHSIDTRHDTVPKLKDFAQKMDVETEKWHFVTGEKVHIYDMADEYFIIAKEDPTADGGYDHSGTLILVDQNRMVRANANGLVAEEVDRFMEDIDRLLKDNSIAGNTQNR